jgi:hypothetical protein
MEIFIPVRCSGQHPAARLRPWVSSLFGCTLTPLRLQEGSEVGWRSTCDLEGLCKLNHPTPAPLQNWGRVKPEWNFEYVLRQKIALK